MSNPDKLPISYQKRQICYPYVKVNLYLRNSRYYEGTQFAWLDNIEYQY